ncbi:MAG: hypothetical protein AB7T63_11525 [Planctomycetota bacterium]
MVHHPDLPPRRGIAALARTAALALVGVLVACGGGGEAKSGLGGPDGYRPPPPLPPVDGIVPTALEGLTAWPGERGVVRLTFTAPADRGSIEAYEVRVSPAHLSPDPASPRYAGSAPLATFRGGKRTPGALETLEVLDLEPGRTLQLAVRVKHASGFGPFSHGVGARVPGALAGPAGTATPVSGPRTITSPGLYRLDRDITAPGTAITISAKDVTLDLAGHTITYGTAAEPSKPGILSEYQYGSGRIWIHGGTIRQGAPGASSPAIQFRGGHDVRFSGLVADLVGPDCSGLVIFDQPSGDIRIDHCTIATHTEVVADRHYPGLAAIWLGGITRACEIDQNLITASPQWGIYVQGNTTTGPFRIHHNRVQGTRSAVANAYMIGVYKPDADVYENLLDGESRGVHIDGQDASGLRCELHDNRIRAQDRPNAEYPVHWAHGVRLETATDAHVHHNDVLVTADAQHSEALALSISMDAAQGVQVHGNRFHATSTHAPFAAKAYVWAGGAASAPADLEIRHNVFQATDVLVQREWDSSHGGPTRDNVWMRDVAQGPGKPVLFERIDVSDIVPSSGHRLIDELTAESMDAITEWANPAAWRSERWFTLRVVVRNESGQPLPGAAVTIDDREGARVATGMTDAEGVVDALVLARVASNGPAFDARGPFAIQVTHAAGSYGGAHDVLGRTAVLVTLGAASSAVDDATAPTGPTTLWAHALSATRARVRWDGADDDTGVIAYLVQVDDEVRALSAVPEAFLGGLEPATEYAICIRPIDAAGQVGDPIGPVTVTTWAEDRGP